MSDMEPTISYTFKEVLERLETKIDALSGKLDKEMEHLDSRVTALETFRSRFLPMSVVGGLLMLIGLAVDIYIRVG